MNAISDVIVDAYHSLGIVWLRTLLLTELPGEKNWQIRHVVNFQKVDLFTLHSSVVFHYTRLLFSIS